MATGMCRGGQEEQLQRERKLRKSLEVKLRDIDGDWHV